MVISELLISNSVDDVLSLYKRKRFKSVTTSGPGPPGANLNMGQLKRSMTERHNDLRQT